MIDHAGDFVLASSERGVKLDLALRQGGDTLDEQGGQGRLQYRLALERQQRCLGEIIYRPIGADKRADPRFGASNRFGMARHVLQPALVPPNMQDLDLALADLGETFDVSREDLEMLFRQMALRAAERELSTNE